MANIATVDLELDVQGTSGGTISSPTGTFVIQTSPSSDVFINDSACYFGDIKVIIPSGSTSSLGTLTAPLTITVTASGSNAYTSSGNALLEGDSSSGLDSGTFQQGQSSTTDTITVTVKKAGQTDVDLT